MGLGVLHLTPFLLYNMDFREFSNMLEGHFRNERNQLKEDWERTRWQTMVLATYSGNVKKGHRLKPTDLITFEWDRKVDIKELTNPEMVKYLNEIFPKNLPKEMIN